MTDKGTPNTMDIVTIPARQDNYVHIIRDPATDAVFVIDPAEAALVLREIEARGWRVSAILNTHHHDDHTAGNAAIKARYGCSVFGAKGDSNRIPGFDVGVEHGDVIPFGGWTIDVLGTPGHTKGHLAYYLAGMGAVFCGDALFSLGCGRLFEGTAAEMWQSLRRLRALPGETRVYCAHEYTLANARFALSIDPENPALQERARAARRQRDQGEPTIPAILADECAANPFLRADQPAMAASLHLTGAAAETVFGELRRRKDQF